MMTFYVLTQTGQVVSRSSVERVKEIENGTDEMKRKLEEFDTDIKRGLKFEDLGTDGDKPNPEMWAYLIDSDPDFREELFHVYQDDGIKEADVNPTPEIADQQFLNMELALPRDGEGPEFARVKKLRDADGMPVGRANNNPMLHFRVFEVEYHDGHTTTMSARSTKKVIDYCCLMSLSITDLLTKQSSSPMLSLNLQMVGRDTRRLRRVGNYS
jgi:hypothetical protein